jgi:hypothetical protein
VADTAYKTIYRDEWIAGFERSRSHLRTAAITDFVLDGKTAVFMVATSNREAVTRGPNGLIPSSSSDYANPTVSLVEAHDKERGTRFKYFTGQANQRAIAQEMGRKVINRAIDNKIIEALDTGTVVIGGAGAQLDKALVSTAVVTLGNAHVPMSDGGLFGALTPNAWAVLTNEVTFTSEDYINVKPMVAGMPDLQAESPQFLKWMGVNWFVYDGLTGAGTSTATTYVWHRSAVGYAWDGAMAVAGYNEEDDYYFARHSVFHGSIKLQNAGIVKITLDDTTFVV